MSVPERVGRLLDAAMPLLEQLRKYWPKTEIVRIRLKEEVNARQDGENFIKAGDDSRSHPGVLLPPQSTKGCGSNGSLE